MPACPQSSAFRCDARNELGRRVSTLFDQCTCTGSLSRTGFNSLKVYKKRLLSSWLNTNQPVLGRLVLLSKLLCDTSFDKSLYFGWKTRYKFSRYILIGLFFSCVGDGLLVWRELFLYGMAAFGIGHVFFISAFGFQPLNLRLGILLYIAGMLGK